MRIALIISFFALFFVGCAPDKPNSDEQKLIEVKPREDSEIQKIIRNPVSANGEIDTVNVAKITFKKDTFFFGKVKEGGVVEYDFQFTNTGKVPLLIHDARSTCGCTIPQFPKEPIPPGADGIIHVRFNTTRKHGYQEKPVTIQSNTYPNETVIYVIGEVTPK